MATCYRHPGRETNVACSNCGRPICPDCMVSTQVGMRCPECARERTPVRRVTATGFGSGAEPATYALIGLNVLAFLAEMLGGGGASALGGAAGGLTDDGGLFAPPIANDGEWYRVVTAGFLHAGAFHLLLNMFALYVLGSLLEPAIGTPRFLGVYFVSLLAGSLGALIIDPMEVTVGASGAIFGLMAAAFVMARRRGVEDLASQIGLFVVINLVFTFSVSGISVGGHIGGLVGGGVAALIVAWFERGHTRRPLVLELGILGALGAALFVACLAAAESGATEIPRVVI
jgi:membrane associated rhomboid family serine protease